MTQVRATPELGRVAALPSRLWEDDELELLAKYATEKYKRPKGTMHLWPAQARVLAEAYQCNGCYAALPVGAGKTLVSYLLPTVFGSKRPMLLIPATLREKTHLDFSELAKHWHGPRAMPIISFEQIQTPNSRLLLKQLSPDLLVIDEAQSIASSTSTRTRRIVEYINDNPQTIVVALTGSPIKTSIMDYWHIMLACLKAHTPLPRGRCEMEQWAEALDLEVQYRRDPGALGKAFGVRNIDQLRKKYQERVNSSWGVVSIMKSSCDQPIHLTVDKSAKVPADITEMIETVRETGETANHELLESGAHVRRHIGELANGFYYYWKPPPPDDWLRARRSWSKFIVEQLARTDIIHDSPALITRANAGHPFLTAWLKIKDIYDPEEHRAVRWISDYALKHAIQTVGSKPHIIWVAQIETGKRLARLSGWQYLGGGQRASRDLVLLSKSASAGKESVILSINAHMTGKNLQAWNRLYYLTCPSSVSRWEQSVGRVHRAGQKKAVHITVFAPIREIRESYKKAIDRSLYASVISGQEQKLLMLGD